MNNDDIHNHHIILNDTLLKQNDIYQELYDDVSAEINTRTFNQLELFNHCLETCQKIFDNSEFKYGQKAKNLPGDLIEDIAILYSQKRPYCSTYGMI